jgi:hypothetical protein
MRGRRKKHRAPGAGRPQIWPAGSQGCWLVVRPETARALGASDRATLRRALLGILAAARPELRWNVPASPACPTKPGIGNG